jgi:hypothetical protein
MQFQQFRHLIEDICNLAILHKDEFRPRGISLLPQSFYSIINIDLVW